MGAGMMALAIQGDIGSLREILKTPGLGIGELNRLHGSWLAELFLVAEQSILPELIDEWLAPSIVWPRAHPTEYFSGHWGGCLAAAMSRAWGSLGLVSRCDALLDLAAPKGLSGEKASSVLSAMVDFGGFDPEGYAYFLARAAGAVQRLDPGHVATFASRLQCGFQDSLAGSVAAGASKAEGSDWDGSWLGAAAAFLRWLSTVDLSNSNYPANARALSLCQPFSRRAELSGELALFCGSVSAMDGFAFDSIMLSSAREVDYPFRDFKGDFWSSIVWEGNRSGPVEQALLHGRGESAKALIEAGFSFDHPMFEDFCSRIQGRGGDILSVHPAVDVPSMLRRALALAERLELGGAARIGQSKGVPVRV